MKNRFTLFLLIVLLTMNACTPQAGPAPTPAGEPIVTLQTQPPAPVSTTAMDPSAAWKQYTNNPFGFAFQYPSTWFGPDEYVSDETLRVSVGSDVVYPYGTDRTEQIYEIRNSYYVIIQYSKNNRNLYWNDTYQSLINLQDGESLSGARGKFIRVRQLDLGRFTGFEYIATLSETAQTEPVYSREVILVDEQSNLLTISGTPNNVEIGSGADWHEVYQTMDEENLSIFHKIVESITTE
jgi:hypothetical protein